MSFRTLARKYIMQALYQFDCRTFDTQEEKESYIEDILTSGWTEKDLPKDAQQFYCDTIKGTIDHLDQIDRKIDFAVKKWKFEHLCRIDLAILRFSTYSLLFLDDVPDDVIIDEAVELVKRQA